MTQWIQFVEVGRRRRLRPAFAGRLQGGKHTTPAETLLTFFSMSDIHITDKESPAQALYSGVTGTFGNTNTSAYSPIILSTTHVLDAAVQTINALHEPDAL